MAGRPGDKRPSNRSNRGPDRGRSSGGSRGSGRSDSRGSGSGGGSRGGARGPSSADRKKLHAGGQLPKWVREEILRATPKDRRDAVIRELESAVESFAAGRFKQAAAGLRRAKAASTRVATIRELLGLSAYQLGNWEEALRELRAFRRMSGETDQMPVEMDCLRALGRSKDVDKTYALFQELGGGRDSDNEARVVYASHLLDQGRLEEAWRVVKPGRLIDNPPASLVRRWAVAARVANAVDDQEAVGKFLAAIRDDDPETPWLEDLERELGV